MVGQRPGWRKGGETPQVLSGASLEVRRQPQGPVDSGEDLSGQQTRGFRFGPEEDEPADIQPQGRVNAATEIVQRIEVEPERLEEKAAGAQAGTLFPRILGPSAPVAHPRSSGMPSRC